MDVMGGIGFVWLVMVIIGLCIAIAPLIIWRNTNRANRLLGQIAIQLGCNPDDIQLIFSGGRLKMRAGKNQKQCPGCNAIRPNAEAVCSFCGHQFPMAPRKVACPDCQTDITHMPPECPECGRRFKYKTGSGV